MPTTPPNPACRSPTEPIIFSKAPSSLSGPNDDVVIPRGSVKTDWEVELAVIIGEHCHYVDEEEALSKVFGYALCNDVSEREYQAERGGQWIKGKSAPTFGPLGPWLVTPDEIADPQDLDMFLDVNGERCQTGNTSTMIFPSPTSFPTSRNSWRWSRATSSPPARRPASAWA
jgi:2-keto-4-pentenoate hydratase/2-oxohepta-3-ene-1,7-dioic acid hydratase in catechol pathway